MDVKKAAFTTFSWVFRFLCGVLFTLPNWFFVSAWFQHTFLFVCKLAIAGIVIMAAWTGLKVGLNRTATPLKSIFPRLALAFAAMGFASLLIEKATFYLNQMTLAIEKMAFYVMKDTSTLSFMDVSQSIELDVIAMFAFDAILIYKSIPLILQAGQRWFDLLILGAASPLAIASFVFDETRHYGLSWWHDLKNIAVSQVCQVTFLAFTVICLFGTKGISSGGELVIRLLIILGGLHRMQKPPAWARGGDAGMFRSMERRYKSGTRNLWKTIMTKKSVEKTEGDS